MGADACELLCLDLPHAESVRGSLPEPGRLERAAADARALSDPTRLRVAAALAAGDELCVCDLAWVCGSTQNLASHHVRQLRTAGLATSRREGKMVMYRLTERGLALLEVVLGSATGVPTGEVEVSGRG
ncbi:MAG: metalloregulator ArsR/SmtB family transcription factor [Nitriliruptor sp.]|uniref:ArsR/SmtB family transcription factor n=1 Tax=Nitriliruptor sp. TaxID=2448056 RepID=UPI0034A08F0A